MLRAAMGIFANHKTRVNTLRHLVRYRDERCEVLLLGGVDDRTRAEVDGITRIERVRLAWGTPTKEKKKKKIE